MSDQHPVLYSTYQWLVPEHFNIAQVCLQRWATNAAEGRRTAIYHEDQQGIRSEWSYRQLADVSNRLANGLRKMGTQKGDRIAVIMSQRPETVAACLAVLGVGGVLVPLSTQLGTDGLALRLRHAEARSIIADGTAAPELATIMEQCPSVQQLIGLEFQNDHTLSWRTLQAREPVDFQPTATLAQDPAILLYTAGTTGAPKGVLHAHRVLVGVLPAFVAAQNWYPKTGDLFWSPVDWTTASGFLHGLLPVLYFGRSLVTTERPARGADALGLLGRHPITNALLLPGDLALMHEAEQAGAAIENIRLRALCVTGDVLNPAMRDWAAATLGTEPNEIYGLTEAPGILGHSQEKWPTRPGSAGRPIPGHQLALLDSRGQPCSSGSAGQLALNTHDIHGHPDPCLFLSYWGNEALTQARYHEGWFLTGDMASFDEDGYCWFLGRVDDVFRVGDHRVSPLEIEDCLKQHPGVANVAVIPKPEGARGNSIKAFVVPADDHPTAQAELEQALQNHVCDRLAAWQMPQHIEIVDRLPTTADGQIRRHVLRAREQQRSMLAGARNASKGKL